MITKASLFRVFLLGILFGSGIFTAFPSYFILLVFLVLLIILFVIKLERRKIFIWLVLGILFSSLRIFGFSAYTDNQDKLSFFASEKEQVVSGRIKNILKNNGEYTSFLLQNVDLEGNIKTGYLFVRLKNTENIQAGDNVVIKGIITKANPEENFSKYLKTKSTDVTLKNPKLLEYVSDESDLFALEYIRGFLKRKIDLFLPKTEGGFLKGILLGDGSGLSEQVNINFKRTGLTHILVISGYNISLIATIILSLLGFLPRKLRIICAGIFVILFTLLVGPTAPVLRACIMGLIALFAMYLGRTTHAWTTLLLAANLMIVKESSILLYDISFQLSFLATLGVMYVSPKLLPYFKFLPDFFSIRESFVLTIASQITTLPIILYNFGTVSFVSPIANILVLPLVPLSMFLGFFMIISFPISRILSFGFGMLAFSCLNLVIKITETLSQYSFALFELPKISAILLFIYYIFLISRLNRNLLQNF